MPTKTFNIIEAKQERAAAEKRARELHEQASYEKRDLTAAEQRDFDQAIATVSQVAARIDRENDIMRAAKPDHRSGGDFDDNTLEGRISGNLRAVARGDAETRDLTLSSMGIAFAPQDYAQVWDWLAPAAVALRSGIQTIDSDDQQVLIPHLTSDPAAAWIAENGTITEADPGGATITVTPTKVGSLVKLSRELADDSKPNAVQMVMSKLQRAVGNAIDLGVFEGSGSSNQPLGIKNVASIQTVSMGTNGAAPTNLDPWLTAIGDLAAANASIDDAVIVMPARTWTELLELKDSQNRYLLSSVQTGGATVREISGVPVYISNQLTLTETQGSSSAANSSYVFDKTQVIMVRSHALRLEATSEAYFSTDEIAVRCLARIGVCVPNPQAVVRIKGIL